MVTENLTELCGEPDIHITYLKTSLFTSEYDLNFLRHNLLLFHKNREMSFPFVEFEHQGYNTTIIYASTKITRLGDLSLLPPS